ncbi:PilZ domain-containing protein [bacterium]|nr:PilZ domain-containing protein [bacterium]
MKKNVIRLEGSKSVWDLVHAWLALPEEQKLFAQLLEREEAKTVTVVSEQMTKGVIQTLDAFEKIAEMYRKLGYPVDKIQKIMGPRVENTIAVFKKLSYIKQLQKRNIVLQAHVKGGELSDRRKAERFETRPEILFKVLEQWHKGYVCDISESGIQIWADQGLNPNDNTTIKLRDFANSRDIKLDGIVIWQKEAQEESYGNRLGLHFRQMLPVPAQCFVPERPSN